MSAKDRQGLLVTHSRLNAWRYPRVGQVPIGGFIAGSSGCGTAAANEFKAREFPVLAQNICDQARLRLPGRA
jgi:hypothetical protein